MKMDVSDFLAPESHASDPSQVMAHRAGIQARAAHLRADEALSLAQSVAKECWTKEQHETYSRRMTTQWQRMQRRFYILLIFSTLAAALALFVGWRVLTVTAESSARLDHEVTRLAEVMVMSCETRNKQLEQQRVSLEELAVVIQGMPGAETQAAAITRARMDLPRPIDCALYDDIARHVG